MGNDEGFLNSFRTSGRVFSTVLTTLVFFFLPSEVEEELNEEDEEVVFEKDWRNDDIALCSVFRLSHRVCTDNKRQTTVRKYCGNSRDRYDTGALQVIPAYNPPPRESNKERKGKRPLCVCGYYNED